MLKERGRLETRDIGGIVGRRVEEEGGSSVDEDEDVMIEDLGKYLGE